MINLFTRFFIITILCIFNYSAFAQTVTSPEEFFGFKMGEDRKLAEWVQLVEYYNLVGEQSDRIKVVNMGATEMGYPFLALYISTPENLARLNEIKAYNDKLVDPRGIPMSEIDEAVENSVAVVVQSFGIHSNEVAAPQTAAETVYDMLTRNDEDMIRILNETLSIFIPAFNPDGQKMVADWYNSNVGTEWETSPLPWLYHKYIGHDTNRDAFATNMASSRYGAEIIFTEWNPQSYIDHHEMGSYSARFYVPPYAEPIRPDGDPLVWREMDWYGAHIAQDEEIHGKTGVINGAYYTGWGHFGFHWITPFHNIAGMLTESASTRLGTPIYIHPDQLVGARYNFPEYEEQINFPNPWPGGWWRVRDNVEQQKIAALALLDISAKNRKMVLRNSYLKASRQTERGKNADIKAYIIPADQHDPLTMEKMINILLGQGIEVFKAPADFTHENHNYKAGSYIISMAQPKQGLVRWLLGRTFYPDNFYTRNVDGSPKRPYDMSTDNIAEYMGVDVRPVSMAVSADLNVVTEKVHSIGTIEGNEIGYVIEGRYNEAFTAVNLLFDAGIEVRRVDKSGNGLNAGDFVIPPLGQGDLLNNIAEETGINFKALKVDPSGIGRPIERLKIGLYRRYLAGNMDEGWTRFLLEQYKFPFDQLYDKDLTRSNLRKYDVIIMPNDNMTRLRGSDEDYAAQFPPEYRSGLKEDETEALDEFVKEGGSLVMLGDAGEYAIEEFNLPIENVVEGISTKEFWSPGSTLRMRFNNEGNKLAYGMPDEGVALFLVSNDVYRVKRNTRNYRVNRIASYKDRDILESGWLLGEDHIADMAVGVTVTHGEGDVVLTGIRPQFRAQTHGTFKILFNALISRE